MEKHLYLSQRFKSFKGQWVYSVFEFFCCTNITCQPNIMGGTSFICCSVKFMFELLQVDMEAIIAQDDFDQKEKRLGVALQIKNRKILDFLGKTG